LFYYLNIILVMSMRPRAITSGRLGGRLAITALSMPILVFGIAPQPLVALLRVVFG
jgi:NADH:ubiquinone oxidoreductase subunit 2 (subunit N)